MTLFSFSNLFSPSSRSSVSQPTVRYSSLQGDGNNNGADQRNMATQRSPRVVRFRDEDMYWHFEFCVG